MPNWKNEAEYMKFGPKFGLKGWAWEFMRRNPAYSRDYENSAAGVQPFVAIAVEGLGATESKSLTLKKIAAIYGARWGQLGPIADPGGDVIPKFLAFPIETEAAMIGAFFEIPKLRTSVVQHPYFATITFDLRGPLETQLKSARLVLRSRKKSSTLTGMSTKKPVHPAPTQWQTYLRVLDAVAAGAKSKEIIKTMAYDKKFGSAQAGVDSPAKRLSAHRKAAIALRSNPLSILR